MLTTFETRASSGSGCGAGGLQSFKSKGMQVMCHAAGWHQRLCSRMCCQRSLCERDLVCDLPCLYLRASSAGIASALGQETGECRLQAVYPTTRCLGVIAGRPICGQSWYLWEVLRRNISCTRHLPGVLHRMHGQLSCHQGSSVHFTLLCLSPVVAPAGVLTALLQAGAGPAVSPLCPVTTLL